MAKIEFVSGDDIEYRQNSATIEDHDLKVPAAYGDLSMKMYFEGSADTLQMFEVKCPPNFEFEAHAHDEQEIVYVLAGSAVFGRQEYPAGSAVSIPGGTLYAFKAGPAGLSFLNFRRCADWSYDTKADVAARRASAAGT